MVMLKIPAHDIQGEVAKRFKEVLMDVPSFQVVMPDPVPFSGYDNDTKGHVIFPYVGVDTRTVTFDTDVTPPNPTTAADISGKWEIIGPNGLNARYILNIGFPAYGCHANGGYTRWTTYFLANPFETSFDPFTFFGDPRGTWKQNRQIPIAIPLVDNIEMEYQTGRGEACKVHGTFAMYHFSDPASVKILKNEAKKLYYFLKTPDDGSGTNWLADNGFQNLRVHPPVYNFYTDKGTICEALMDFTAYIKIDTTPA